MSGPLSDSDSTRIDAAKRECAGREAATLVIPRQPAREDSVNAGAAGDAYRMLGEIGHGGMSVVYVARDVKLGRYVAIKRLNREFLANAAMRARFSREAQLVASLNHIYIVKLYDFDISRPEPQIVMEYVAGPGKPPAPDWPAPPLNLEQKLEQTGAPLTLRSAVVLVRKLCAAIDYAHKHGVIHRDLKPSNVLLDEHGEPRLVDFGIARETVAEAAKLTMTGARMLSLGYSAPEQENDPAAADERSDVYSLGGILYFCLTGENPRFYRDSRLPDSLRPILLKAMERDPAQRWPSARDFADVLTQSAGELISPLTDPGMWRCKWCSNLNPVASRYCSQCGWDGMESCPECGGETRVGVRFCGQCSTDIKLFEDMRALLARVREYRRQKDFGRIKDAMEGVNRFQPRGDRGRELMREIMELDETAAWALKRKDELVQAIATGLDRQNYEEVRERLNEYGVLDDGPEYSELRRELPWRIAERNILALRTELAEVRRMLAEKRPGEAGRRLDGIETRLLALGQLESQYPSLKGVLTPASGAEGGQPGSSYAKAMAALWKDVEQVKVDLGAVRAVIDRLLQGAADACKAQDYAGCLKLCEAIRETTVEPTAGEELAGKAMGQMEQIERLNVRAWDAIRRGNLKSADRLAHDIMGRFQRDSESARRILAEVGRIRRRRAVAAYLAATAAAAVLYGLSIGPVYAGMAGPSRTTVSRRDTLRTLYAPVFWLRDNTFLKAALDGYANHWEAAIFNGQERR